MKKVEQYCPNTCVFTFTRICIGVINTGLQHYLWHQTTWLQHCLLQNLGNHPNVTFKAFQLRKAFLQEVFWSCLSSTNILWPLALLFIFIPDFPKSDILLYIYCFCVPLYINFLRGGNCVYFIHFYLLRTSNSMKHSKQEFFFNI